MRRRSFLTGSACLTGMGTVNALSAAPAAPVVQYAPETSDPALADKLDSLVRTFHGDVGLYVRHLPSGQAAAVRADELFPTASLIKTAILLALFDRIDRGELDYHQFLEYDGSYRYPGMSEDILASFKPGEKIRLSKLVMLMLTISDNSASIWLQELAGTGTRINEVLERCGFRNLRINARTPGREDAYKEYGWGQTTPGEICDLLVKIRCGEAISPSASEAMYRALARSYWDGEALSEIPPWVQVISKEGALDQSRSEAVLVNAPSGDYVFCVITKNQADESWGETNDGFRATAHRVADNLEALRAVIWLGTRPPKESVEPIRKL